MKYLKLTGNLAVLMPIVAMVAKSHSVKKLTALTRPMSISHLYSKISFSALTCSRSSPSVLWCNVSQEQAHHCDSDLCYTQHSAIRGHLQGKSSISQLVKSLKVRHSRLTSLSYQPEAQVDGRLCSSPINVRARERPTTVLSFMLER